jgi:hypothetical protein
MQSAKGKTKRWILDWDVLSGSGRWENPLMGWASSADYMQGTNMAFRSKEDAVSFVSQPLHLSIPRRISLGRGHTDTTRRRSRDGVTMSRHLMSPRFPPRTMVCFFSYISRWAGLTDSEQLCPCPRKAQDPPHEVRLRDEVSGRHVSFDWIRSRKLHLSISWKAKR